MTPIDWLKCVIIIFVIAFIAEFITNKPEESNSIASGTAWVLNEDGYLVTAYHVVRNRHHFRVALNNTYINAAVVATDSWNDIAILHIDSKTSNYLTLELNYNEGEFSNAYGYPRPDVYGNHLNTSSGYLRHKLQSSTYDYIGRTCPGNSGGPVQGAFGVVGLVSKGWSPFDSLHCSMESTGPLSKYVVALANHNGILYHLSITYNTKVTSTENNTVMIYAW